jgi:hypothetical protein
MLEVAEADLELEAGLCPSGKARRACTAVKIARSSVEVFSQGQSVPDTILFNQASVRHLSRKHRLATAPAIALLQDAMPRPGLPLVHFNDTRCGSIAELRSVILKARRLAHDDVERERAAAAVKTWLLAQIGEKRAAPAADIGETAPDEPFAPESLAA